MSIRHSSIVLAAALLVAAGCAPATSPSPGGAWMDDLGIYTIVTVLDRRAGF